MKFVRALSHSVTSSVYSLSPTCYHLFNTKISTTSFLSLLFKMSLIELTTAATHLLQLFPDYLAYDSSRFHISWMCIVVFNHTFICYGWTFSSIVGQKDLDERKLIWLQLLLNQSLKAFPFLSNSKTIVSAFWRLNTGSKHEEYIQIIHSKPFYSDLLNAQWFKAAQNLKWCLDEKTKA